MIRKPQIRGYLETGGKRAVPEALGDLERAMRKAGQNNTPNVGYPTTLNDSDDFITGGMIYGRGSTGRLALAGGEIRPVLMAMGSAGEGESFPYTSAAEDAEVFTTTTELPAIGSPGFIDNDAPGKVTFTVPTGARYVVGFLAGDTVSDERRVKFSLNVFIQTGR